MTRSFAGLAKPDYFTHPDWTVTLGPEVAEVAALAGFTPYPEQALMLDEVFALDKATPSRSAAFETAIISSRQQMKTGLLKMCALGWLYVLPQPLVIWSAHEFGTSQEAFRDMQSLIASSPDLDRRVAKIRTGAGSESIEMKDGSRLRFKARTSGGGRGLTAPKVILDEAFALEPAMMGALLPTLIAVPDPQVVYGSSAGMAKSAILRGVRDRGRAGSDRVAYAEWLAPRKDCREATCQHEPGTAGCALDDKDLWRHSCPVTARKDPKTMQAIANLRQALPPEEFMRECLGWWDEPMGDAPIPETTWATMLDVDSQIEGIPSIALDVGPERDWACLVGAGMNADGKVHVEITSNSTNWDHRQGVAWVVQRALEVTAGNPLYIAAGSAAESLVPDLEAVGVYVVRVPPRDGVAACGRFYDLATGGDLAHPDQTELATAVSAARRKWIGDRAFVWVRPEGRGDLTPMYGATLAVWAAAFSGVSAW